MTQNFAESLGYCAQDIDTSVAGSIYELQDRPGGSREPSNDRHQGNFHGIGRIMGIPMMLSRPSQEARTVLVNMIIAEPGTQVGLVVDFTVDPGFVLALPSWISDATRSDPMSQSFQRGFNPTIQFELPDEPRPPKSKNRSGPAHALESAWSRLEAHMERSALGRASSAYFGNAGYLFRRRSLSACSTSGHHLSRRSASLRRRQLVTDKKDFHSKRPRPLRQWC